VTVLAVALAGAIGALGGYLVQLRASQGPPNSIIGRLLLDALASVGLGLIAGSLLFALFGDDAVDPVSSGMLFAYLSGALVPALYAWIESASRLPRDHVVEFAAAIALGFVCLAGGLALATRIT